MSSFYEGMAEILEIPVDKVHRDLRLDEEQWGSLAVVSTIALIDELYDRTVGADALAACKTVGDVEDLAARSGPA